MSTEITLSLKGTNRLLCYKPCQQHEWLLGSIRPWRSCGGSSAAVFGAEQTHTYSISPTPEQQMSVKGTQQCMKTEKESMVMVGAVASAVLNFLYAKERGDK